MPASFGGVAAPDLLMIGALSVCSSAAFPSTVVESVRLSSASFGAVGEAKLARMCMPGVNGGIADAVVGGEDCELMCGVSSDVGMLSSASGIGVSMGVKCGGSGGVAGSRGGTVCFASPLLSSCRGDFNLCSLAAQLQANSHWLRMHPVLLSNCIVK